MSNWETLFFQHAAFRHIMGVEQMCALRIVCERWNNAIKTVDNVYEKIIEADILRRLHYDKRSDGKPCTYEKDYYDRQHESY